MTDIALHNTHRFNFGSLLGLIHPFFTINVHTLYHTWLVCSIVIILALMIKVLVKHSPFIRFIVIDGAQIMYGMLEQSVGICYNHHFYFIASLFIYISCCNLAPLIPGLEEPTQDINTAFAFGITSFMYIQIAAIKKFGLWHYIRGEFLTPIFLLPLHVIGKLASILSISLRLFGNIFGGSIITKIYFSAIQYSIFSNILGIAVHIIVATLMTIIVTTFFTVIEGLLQAFVFTMLTITYLAIATRDESGH